MKILYFFLFFFLFFAQTMVAQTNAKITDVDFTIKGDNIVVTYSIVDAHSNEAFSIDLKFITDKNEIIQPKFVSGDVGNNVKADPPNKTIIWGITYEQKEITATMKAVVNITSVKLSYRGPTNAFLSVLVPGLGGYFVDKNKTRAILTTSFAMSTIAIGMFEKLLSDQYYSDYKDDTYQSDMDENFKKANSNHHAYYVLTRIGAAIWISDIIWVTFKGIHNKNQAKRKSKNAFNSSWRLDYRNGLQLNYVITF